MEKKNSIKERAKKVSPETKAKVTYLNKCFDALYLLQMNDFVTKREHDEIFERINNQF